MKLKKNEKGFTLVEVIVSIALIGMLLLLLSTFMVNSLGMIKTQGENTNLLYAAQKELDNAMENPTYEVQDDRLSIIRKPTTMNVEGSYIEGVLIEIKDVKEAKVILSTFITN
ncbi:type II secretion system GspH family protein [Irregularibacter muris]|uniref:Type II secretion system GspH family protein n=1 Tax=Irregularibacter muris TaxID=1796619 RepID=A0AAE3HEW9_9FIRM|nr:type II secretion system protein [Irregularibacter muris]MCR1897883.1 type II secretion system GspH family protein [Irregularibacter muris]